MAKQRATRVKDNGDGTFEYTDGSTRRANGTLAKVHPRAAPIITSDNAPALAKRRHQLAEEKACEGMLQAVKDNVKGYVDTPPAAWGKIVGMRNVLVHGYFDIDCEIVWRVVEDYLPDLKRLVQAILEEGGS